MPIIPIQINAGIVTEQTERGAKGFWSDGQHVRFRFNRVEKIGGWVASSDNTADGKARTLHAWRTLSDDSYIGVGTHQRLFVWQGGTFHNITPLRDSTSAPFSSSQLNGPFDSSAGSATITVNHTSHGITSEGTFVTFDNATASPNDGLTIDGEYEVQSIPDANSYTITHSVAATTTETGFGGANVDYDYEVDAGSSYNAPGLGYGAGTWSSGTYSTARTSSGLLQFARTWSLDNWGENLIANIRGAKIYVWDASAGTSTRATEITASPDSAKLVLVSPQARHLIAFGAHDGSNDDPLLIRWSDQEDYDTWVPSNTNRAGDYRLEKGTQIVAAIPYRNQILIWTDSFMYSMRYRTDSLVFSFNEISPTGCIGPNGVVATEQAVFWWDRDNFYKYDGVVRVMRCDIHRTVFDDIENTQYDLFFAYHNPEFNEVWFFYASEGQTEIDKYVIYNYVLDAWSLGPLARTSFISPTEDYAVPHAMGTDGKMYLHETGRDDDDMALTAFVESAAYEIDDGDSVMHLKRLIPDFLVLDGAVDITVKGKKWPQDAEEIEKGPYRVESDTKFIFPRLRARQARVRIESSEECVDWRMGTMLADVAQDGFK